MGDWHAWGVCGGWWMHGKGSVPSVVSWCASGWDGPASAQNAPKCPKMPNFDHFDVCESPCHMKAPHTMGMHVVRGCMGDAHRVMQALSGVHGEGCGCNQNALHRGVQNYRECPPGMGHMCTHAATHARRRRKCMACMGMPHQGARACMLPAAQAHVGGRWWHPTPCANRLPGACM